VFVGLCLLWGCCGGCGGVVVGVVGCVFCVGGVCFFGVLFGGWLLVLCILLLFVGFVVFCSCWCCSGVCDCCDV